MRFIMPEGMRYSTLSERHGFYAKEFDIKSLERWMGWRKPENTSFACIIGRHTKIYPKRFRRISSRTVIFQDIDNFGELKKALAEYMPEGAYYDRNAFREKSECSSCSRRLTRCFRCKNFLGQELAFDVDPENVTCPMHGDLAEKMRKHQGLGFCDYEFDVVREETLKLYDHLSKRFSDLRIVYSGRGFHVHVLDDHAYRLTMRERRKLAREMIKKNILIDEWVTSGEMRLIRLPYSLHGMVSRICMPVKAKEIPKFDPVKNKKVIPGFFTASSLP